MFIELLHISDRTILPLVQRNSWQSSKQLEASVEKAPVDPKDEKLQVSMMLSLAGVFILNLMENLVNLFVL